jgi:hypothetical protein
MLAPGVLQAPAERVRELVAALEVPFDQSQIDWRVMNTTKGQQPARGQVVPYADQRALTDGRAITVDYPLRPDFH